MIALYYWPTSNNLKPRMFLDEVPLPHRVITVDIGRGGEPTVRVLDRCLAGRAYIAGDCGIADIACHSWIVPHRARGQDLAAFPYLRRWFETGRARPGTQRAYEGAPESYSSAKVMSDAARKTLFGQTAASVRAHNGEKNV